MTERKRRRGLANALGAIAVAAGAFLALRFALSAFGAEPPERDLSLAGLLLLLAGLVALLFLVLAVHEIGHLLCGRLAGFRPLLFILGPLRLERRHGGWSAGFNPALALWGGVAASVPTDTHELRRRTVRMVAGGPVSSLAVGTACLAIGILLGPPEPGAPSSRDLLPLAFLVFGAGSVLIGLVTLFPGRTSGFDTDGARLLRLVRGGPEAEGEVAVMALTGLTMAGRRPREWDTELLDRALAIEPGSLMGIVARQLAFAHLLDLGDADGAGRRLDEALAHRDRLPTALRPGLLAQGAYFLTVHGGKTERARELLSQAKGEGIGTAHQLSMARAALSLSEGDLAGAGALLERAESELDRSLDPGLARAEREWIERLKRAVDSRRSGAGPTRP